MFRAFYLLVVLQKNKYTCVVDHLDYHYEAFCTVVGVVKRKPIVA